MGKHLQTLVLPEVLDGILIDRLRLAMTEVCHYEVERLLIALHQLGVLWVKGSANSRRQHIVDRNLVVVFLDVDGAHRHLSCLCRSVV